MNDSAKEFERRVGTTLKGKWRLERLLGIGGMAAVYVGVHKIGRRDAIKILHPEVARNKDLRARFEQEAHAVNRFTHPGAVEIRDIDVSDEGAPFLVMELLEGEPLSERARRTEGLALDELLRLTDELLDVLAAAHAQGIVHRDIKLDNLFVTTEGRLKVLDFGIARMRDGAPKSLNTRTGATLGTVPYMAPEQVKGLTIDGRADVFAVGATMFRLIAKRRIHEARTESELLVKMATQPAPSLALIAPSTPEGVCLVVDRALAFQRERRYPDAETMQADIRALRKNEPPGFATARLAEGDRPDTLPEIAGDAPALGTGIGGNVEATVVAPSAVAAAVGATGTAMLDASAVVNDALADMSAGPRSVIAAGARPSSAGDITVAESSAAAHSVSFGAPALGVAPPPPEAPRPAPPEARRTAPPEAPRPAPPEPPRAGPPAPPPPAPVEPTRPAAPITPLPAPHSSRTAPPVAQVPAPREPTAAPSSAVVVPSGVAPGIALPDPTLPGEPASWGPAALGAPSAAAGHSPPVAPASSKRSRGLTAALGVVGLLAVIGVVLWSVLRRGGDAADAAAAASSATSPSDDDPTNGGSTAGAKGGSKSGSAAATGAAASTAGNPVPGGATPGGAAPGGATPVGGSPAGASPAPAGGSPATASTRPGTTATAPKATAPSTAATQPPPAAPAPATPPSKGKGHDKDKNKK